MRYLVKHTDLPLRKSMLILSILRSLVS